MQKFFIEPDLFISETPVAWEKICRPKAEGGLGIKNCSIWNTAAVAKHIWFIVAGKECLWVRWIHGIYLRSASFWQCPVQVNSSWYWRKLLKLRTQFERGYVGQRWVPSAAGIYTVQEGYKWLCGSGLSWPMSKFIWHRYNIPKHATCYWRMVRGRLDRKRCKLK